MPKQNEPIVEHVLKFSVDWFVPPNLLCNNARHLLLHPYITSVTYPTHIKILPKQFNVTQLPGVANPGIYHTTKLFCFVVYKKITIWKNIQRGIQLSQYIQGHTN